MALEGMTISGLAEAAKVNTETIRYIEEVDAKMCDLAAIREVLVSVADACPGEGPGRACPILDAMDEGETER